MAEFILVNLNGDIDVRSAMKKAMSLAGYLEKGDVETLKENNPDFFNNSRTPLEVVVYQRKSPKLDKAKDRLRDLLARPINVVNLNAPEITAIEGRLVVKHDEKDDA